MSRDEARAAALAAGLREDQITEEHLRFYGYTPPAPTEAVTVGPVIAPDHVKASLSELEAEAKANRLPAQITSAVGNVLGWIKAAGLVAILFCCFLFLAGCATTAAQKVATEQATVVKALHQQHCDFEDAFIAYYRSAETARIDDLYQAALKSSTTTKPVAVQKAVTVRVVQADGTATEKQELQTVTEDRQIIEVNVAEALAKQRIDLLAKVETRIKDMRSQQARICENYLTYTAYSEALHSYFTQKASTYEALAAAQDNLLQFLDTFVKKK